MPAIAPIIRPLRAGAWWEHKLSPILATMYATAALTQIAISSLVAVAGLALAALIVCASYVSVLNDLTDAEDDRATGRSARWLGETRLHALVLLGVSVAAGIAFLILWRNDAPVFISYLCSWLAFALYSVPPIRLKTRGVWGVLADAAGAHLCPTLFAVFLAGSWSRAAGSAWTIAVGLWAFAAGTRGILRHQIEDAERDRTIGLRTFACVRGTDAAVRLGRLAFVIELAAFAVMLWGSRGVVAASFLLLYGVFAVMRRRRLGVSLTIVRTRQLSRTAMEEYYIVLYPAAYLLAMSWRQPAALLLLALHAALFSHEARYFLHAVVTMARPLPAAAAR